MYEPTRLRDQGIAPIPHWNVPDQHWSSYTFIATGMAADQVAQQALQSALATLKPEGLKALGDAIALIQDAQGQRRSVETVEAVAVNLNSGDTAFILICTSLVLMMTIPGLALFYGGLSQAPNVLATVHHLPVVARRTCCQLRRSCKHFIPPGARGPRI